MNIATITITIATFLLCLTYVPARADPPSEFDEDAIEAVQKSQKSDDALNKRFAVDAVARYGPLATSLLPELKHQITDVDNPELKAMMQRAITSIDRPLDTAPTLPAKHPRLLQNVHSGSPPSVTKKSSPSDQVVQHD